MIACANVLPVRENPQHSMTKVAIGQLPFYAAHFGADGKALGWFRYLKTPPAQVRAQAESVAAALE
jgi:hypothetical protein